MGMKIDVLVICAHPDDAELSCSGTLMAEKSHGRTIGIVDLTRGELGSRGNANTRSEEAAAAAEIMQLDARVNLGLPDGFFQNEKVAQLAVIEVIRRFQPNIVLTNATTDRHPDHGKGAQLVANAAFLSGLFKIETFDAETGAKQSAWRPAQVWHFVQDRFIMPHFVYDISTQMAQKMAAIRAFKTQFDTLPDNEPQTYISTPGFLKNIEQRAAMFGKMIGVQYGEGFTTEKTLGVNNFSTLVNIVT